MATQVQHHFGNTLTYSELEGLWIQAGGPKSLAPLMAAIALAESQGHVNALNPNDNGGTQTSVGLWQVSTGTHQFPAAWRTPLGNAREAVVKYHSQGLRAWGTYTSGAYKAFLRGNVPPSAGTAAGGGGGSGSAGGGGASPAQLDAFLTSASPSGGVLADAGALLHGTAIVLDRIFGLFAPGQGWRIVFGATAVLLLFASYRAFGGPVI